jgi:hypothetical protein
LDGDISGGGICGGARRIVQQGLMRARLEQHGCDPAQIGE